MLGEKKVKPTVRWRSMLLLGLLSANTAGADLRRFTPTKLPSGDVDLFDSACPATPAWTHSQS